MELELGGVFVREVISLWRESFSVQFVFFQLLLCARHRKSEFIFRGLPLLTMEMMAAAGRVLRREQMCGSGLMSLNSPNFTNKKGNCLL